MADEVAARACGQSVTTALPHSPWLRPGKTIYRLYHQRSARGCITGKAIGWAGRCIIRKAPRCIIWEAPLPFGLAAYQRAFLEEIEFPASCDVRSADFGHEMSFVGGSNQSVLLQARECSTRRHLAAMAAVCRLSDAERDGAVVVSIVLADQQQQDRNMDRPKCCKYLAVIDRVGQHDERLVLGHFPLRSLSTSSQSVSESGGT